MANKPFDRCLINARERPISSDINQAQSEIDRTLRTIFDYFFQGRASNTSDAAAAPISGFIGEALKPRPVSPVAMQVRLPAGLGFAYNAVDVPTGIAGITEVNDLSRWKPLITNSDVIINVPAAPSAPNTRIDIIEVTYNRRMADTGSRDVLNIATGIFDPTNLQKTLAWDMESSVGVVNAPANSTTAIGYKAGVPGNPGVVPSTSPGYIKIAEILIASAASTLDADVMVDRRSLLFQANQGSVACVLSTATAGPLVSSMIQVSAPPGIQPVVVSAALSNAEAHLYLLDGEPPAPPYLPEVVACCGDSSITPVAVTSVTQVTVDSSLQTLLAGSQASPATKVAIGQKLVKAVLKASGSLGNPYTYNVMVKMRGG